MTLLQPTYIHGMSANKCTYKEIIEKNMTLVTKNRNHPKART